MSKRLPHAFALLCAACSNRAQESATPPTQPADASALPVAPEPSPEPADDSAQPEVIGLGDVGLRSGYSTALPWPEGAITHAQDQLAIKGSIDRDRVWQVIDDHIAEIEYCYGVPQQDDLVGSMTLLFVITNTGKVASTSHEDVTRGADELATCVAKAVKRWQFPEVEGEGVALVEWPFSFAPR